MKTYTRKRQEYQEIECVQELCRLCLGKAETGVQIFKDGQDVCAAIAMRITICVGLEMKHEDSLPNLICVACLNELDKYYKFRRMCEVSYQKLKSHLQALKYKEQQNNKPQPLVENKTILKSIEPIENKLMAKSIEPIENKLTAKSIEPIENKLMAKSMEPSKDELTIEERPELVLESFSEKLSQVDETTAGKVVEMEEVQIPIQAEANPDIGTFLSTILAELGILVRHDDGLLLQGIKTFELETGDDEQLVVELVEENDEPDELSEKFPIVDIYQEVNNVPEQSSPNIKEELTILSDAKPKQNNIKESSKVSGAWCGRCGASFSSRSALARHARAHAAVRVHACAECGRAFQQKAVLERHKLVHLEVRPHRCTLCTKSFTQRGALAAHAAAQHAARAPLALHRCTLCDKVFLYPSGLSRHTKAHTGRVFECSTCEKQFKDRSSLMRHLRQCHKQARINSKGGTGSP